MRKICKVDGCDKYCFGNGYCQRHYNQVREHGKIIKTRFDWGKECRVDGCKGKTCGQGYCNRHYQQFKKYGKILKRTQIDPNKIVIKGSIAHILLYNKYNGENGFAIIDSEDVRKIDKYKWSKDDSGYVSTRKNGQTVRLHNFILKQKTNRKIQVDHRNRIKHDYRKSNLRLCTSSQNNCNHVLQSNNTSGFKGVYLNKRSKKWIAQVKIDGKQYCVGCFCDKIEAARARDKAAIKMHGDFAVLNFPNEV